MRRTLDTLGRPARPLRYPVTRSVKLSKDASETVNEMAEVQGYKAMKVMRRAIMKDVYIYKAKKKKQEAKDKINELS